MGKVTLIQPTYSPSRCLDRVFPRGSLEGEQLGGPVATSHGSPDQHAIYSGFIFWLGCDFFKKEAMPKFAPLSQGLSAHLIVQEHGGKVAKAKIPSQKAV